jgi:hypothetical protein
MGFETFWASNGALVHSGDVIAASVREAARRAGGMVARERYADAGVVGPLDAAGTMAQGGSSIAASMPWPPPGEELKPGARTCHARSVVRHPRSGPVNTVTYHPTSAAARAARDLRPWWRG